MQTNDPALMHLQTSALSVDCPGCDTPERLMVAAENLSAAGLDPADLDDYEPEVEEEVDRRREWDRILRYGMVLLFAASAFGLLAPATPTPIDDSLPSGLHDAGRATNPATATDGWRGFLWTT